MKKLIFLLAAITFTTTGKAQESARFTIGSKFGFGHSYIMPYNNYGFHGSWLAGLTTAYQVSEHWAFGADALYSSEGAKFKMGELTSTTELDYLRVPLKAMYLMKSSTSDFRPKLSVGPTFGVLMAEDTGYKDMDFGVNAALGFNYELFEEFWLTTDVNYYHGLMDIYAGNSEKDRNGNIRLEVGLVFGL